MTARIPPDRIPADDSRTVAVRVIDRARVLLVNGQLTDTASGQSQGGMLYLRNALTPVPPAEVGRYYIQVQTITPAELETTDLSAYAAVAIANVVDFTDAARAALDSYLRHGGGVMVFPGEGTNRGFYNEKLDFLPAKFGEPRSPGGDRFFSLKDRTYEHPIVSIWNDPAAGSLATARFYKMLPLVLDTGAHRDAGKPVAVIRFTDGVVALAERTWGFGRVVQFSSSADTAWNDLAVRPAYVPLIHRVLGALLNRGDEALNLQAGRLFTHGFKASAIGQQAEVRRVGEEPEKFIPIENVNGEALLRFDETDRAGAYTVAVPGEPPLTFAVQANADESHLDEFRKLDSLRPAAEVVRLNPKVNARDSIHQGGAEFSFLFAIFALAAVCAETVVAGRSNEAK